MHDIKKQARHYLTLTKPLNVIHGNYGPGGGFRGVSEQKWSASNRVLFYAYPKY